MTPDSAAHKPRDNGDTFRMSLVALVVIGTIVVTLAGALLFGWLAWLLSDQPAPLRGDSGYWDWLEHTSGEDLFDAARTTATLLAIVGIGGAALVAYRRQDTAERAHSVAIAAMETARNQHSLDSQKYELDRTRHALENDRRADDRERELRGRFASVAEQLGSEKYAVRHAGAYALASLADDWHRFGNDGERQVCVDLLCAQLRSPRTTIQFYDDNGVPEDIGDSPEDLEVRKTIVALIRSHRPLNTDKSLDDWKVCALDLAGANLSDFNLAEIDLHAANLDDSDLTRADLHKADLSRASLARTELVGAKFNEANLSEANLFSAKVRKITESTSRARRADFAEAILRGAWFTSASLPYANFEKADLTGAHLAQSDLVASDFQEASLEKANFYRSSLMKATFVGANVRGTEFVHANLSDADFQDAEDDSRTAWPKGLRPAGVVPRPEPNAAQ